MLYGPLVDYIDEAIDDIFKVKHIGCYFIVDNFKDKDILCLTATSFNIKIPDIIVTKFDDQYYPIATDRFQGVIDYVPPTVINVFFDYGEHTLVCIFYMF